MHVYTYACTLKQQHLATHNKQINTNTRVLCTIANVCLRTRSYDMRTFCWLCVCCTCLLL